MHSRKIKEARSKNKKHPISLEPLVSRKVLFRAGAHASKWENSRKQ